MEDLEHIAKHYRKYCKDAFFKHKQPTASRPLDSKRCLPPSQHLHVSKEYDLLYDPNPTKKKQMLQEARLNHSYRSRTGSNSSFVLSSRPQSVVSQVKQQAYDFVKQAELALREEKENTQICHRVIRRGSVRVPKRTNLHKQEALEDFRENSGNSALWMRKKLESRSHRRVI
jgi:hypothetical protein